MSVSKYTLTPISPTHSNTTVAFANTAQAVRPRHFPFACQMANEMTHWITKDIPNPRSSIAPGNPIKATLDRM